MSFWYVPVWKCQQTSLSWNIIIVNAGPLQSIHIWTKQSGRSFSLPLTSSHSLSSEWLCRLSLCHSVSSFRIANIVSTRAKQKCLCRKLVYGRWCRKQCNNNAPLATMNIIAIYKIGIALLHLPPSKIGDHTTIPIDAPLWWQTRPFNLMPTIRKTQFRGTVGEVKRERERETTNTAAIVVIVINPDPKAFSHWLIVRSMCNDGRWSGCASRVECQCNTSQAKQLSNYINIQPK